MVMHKDKLAIDKFLCLGNWTDWARRIDFGFARNALLCPPFYVLVPTSGDIDLEASKQAARELAISYQVKPGLIVWGRSPSPTGFEDLAIALFAEGFINFWVD